MFLVLGGEVIIKKPKTFRKPRKIQKHLKKTFKNAPQNEFLKHKRKMIVHWMSCSEIQ